MGKLHWGLTVAALLLAGGNIDDAYTCGPRVLFITESNQVADDLTNRAFDLFEELGTFKGQEIREKMLRLRSWNYEGIP